MPLMNTLLVLTALVSVAPSFAAGLPWEEHCRLARTFSFPLEHRPKAAEAAALKNCVSENLYYGFGGPVDFAKARQCAFLEMDKGDELVFGGSALLMTVYANGRGAKRDFALAVKAACQLEAAPAEMEGRIDHLKQLEADRWQGTDFSLCDNITSGFMSGHCAAHQKHFVDEAYAARLQSLTLKWSADDTLALKALQASARPFFKARLENEVDLSGTARGAFVLEEEQALETSFLEALETAQTGRLPLRAEKDLNEAENKLNKHLIEIMTKTDFSYGTVTKEGIKTAQRLWFDYRDAWETFAQAKYPTVSTTIFLTWVTEKRVAMLEEFLKP